MSVQGSVLAKCRTASPGCLRKGQLRESMLESPKCNSVGSAVTLRKRCRLCRVFILDRNATLAPA